MKRSVPSLGSFAAALFIGLGVQVDVSAAQGYPSQPIKIIVATPPGGIADLVGRTFAQKLSEGGKTAVVENRTGAGGALAADVVAKAAPDGYTLFVSMHQTNAILPHLVSKLSYDPLKDFSPILNATGSANILVVHPSIPAKTVKELVAYAKANPNKLTYASQGNGSSGHVVGEQFKQLAGISIAHVPYRGAAPASQDLVAGHVSMMFDIVPLAQHADCRWNRACARGRLAATAHGNARGADHGRIRVPANRRRPMVWHCRASRDAARNHRLAQRRGPKGVLGAGGA